MVTLVEVIKMTAETKPTVSETHPTCGIIMPISAIDGCSAEHWAEVLSILRDVIQSAGFEPNLVSDADDIGIIQKRIVQNVYNNEIVVCDVSGKNPNVMFELGLRLAFDKAAIIIKDDFTDYSFDTSVIEHLSYPRDLRFTKIIDFKEKLKAKIIATYEKSKADPNYSTFLKSFGEYKVSHLQPKEVSSEAYILESLEELKKELHSLNRTTFRQVAPRGIPLDEEMIDSGCIQRVILDFVKQNHIFSLPELRKLRNELTDFVKNNEHIKREHGPEEKIALNVQRSLDSDDFRRLLRGLKQVSFSEDGQADGKS
jgi:hypothetical protein